MPQFRPFAGVGFVLALANCQLPIASLSAVKIFVLAKLDAESPRRDRPELCCKQKELPVSAVCISEKCSCHSDPELAEGEESAWFKFLSFRTE
jgi:hypothetical protein